VQCCVCGLEASSWTPGDIGVLALSNDEKLTAVALQGLAVGGAAWLGQYLQ